MDHLVVPAELWVFVRDGVEAVGAARDDFPHAVLLEGLDVLLRLRLPEVFVADPPRRIAVAGLLGCEDRERNAGRTQNLNERTRDLLIAPVVRRCAPDEVEVLRVRLLGERRHAQVIARCPVSTGLPRLAPRVSG